MKNRESWEVCMGEVGMGGFSRFCWRWGLDGGDLVVF
jgi:hypothetical protein